MKKKLGIALGVLVLLLAGLALVVQLQPAEFRIERSQTIKASPAALFAEVNDLRAWDHWSPWRHVDPTAKITYFEPSVGKGATFAWDGNDEVGAGTLTILDSQSDRRVEIEQAFVRPMEGQALMEFTFEPAGHGTRTTWKMSGKHPFIGKAMCLVINMEKMLGPKFEEGLASLQKAVENSTATTDAASPPARSDVTDPAGSDPVATDPGCN